MWSALDCEKNYCYVCRVGITYDAYEDIQLCIDFDLTCDEFWMYHYQKSWKTRFGTCEWTYRKNYIDDHMICLNDK